MPRYVKGVGMTKFGLEDRSTIEMASQAISDCLNDSDVSLDDIDAAVLATVSSKLTDERQRHYSPLLASILKRRIPIIQHPAVCGGGGAAFHAALKTQFNNILVLGVDKVVSSPSNFITKEIMNAGDNFWEQDEGMVFPAVNALVAQEHMQKYGTTKDDLSLVALKNHDHGMLNPKARFYKKKISLEKIKASPMIAEPFNLFDCSVSVNGAAAAVVTNEKTDVEVKGSAMGMDLLAPFERETLSTWEGNVQAAKQAFEQAHLTPSDIDVAELHDAFTIVELIAYEDIGFCKKGESKKMIRDKVTSLDGKLPINTSGGLKAKGHPISPTGVSQIVEIVNQLRGKCDDRQVHGAKYGLTHNVGGAGGTTTINIFKKI